MTFRSPRVFSFMLARPLLAALTFACASISCTNPAPVPLVVPEPVTPTAEPEPEPGGMAPRPSAEPTALAAPQPEPAVDPDAVQVPPLDQETTDALAAFVAAQRSIAAETAVERQGPKVYDVEVSPRAKAALPSIKRASREAARRVIGAGLAAGAKSPAVLAIQVRKAFIAAGASVRNPKNSGSVQSIGTIDGIEIERPAGHPDKLALVVTLSLPCASDGSLYVLQEQPRGAPSVVLAAEANGYTSISGGQFELTHRLSLPDEHGGWFAVVASSKPWCSSAWRGIDYGVFVPGASADAPRRIFHEHDSAYLDSGLCSIETGRDDFQVGWSARTRFSDDLTRRYVHHYARRLGAFVRAQPIVSQPIDLPQEWVAMPWDEARRFTAPQNADALRPWHAKLVHADTVERARLALKSEDEAQGTVRLSLTCDKCKTLPAELFIDVRKDGPGWVMEAVTPAP
jgi:hypothetical protein